MRVKKSLLMAVLSVAALKSVAQPSPVLQSDDIANWIKYTVVADRVRQELADDRRDFAYMDRPYAEHVGTHKRLLKTDGCVVEKRVYPLTDRIIVQYIDQCDGRIIKETSQER
jgi:hypothetical protein